MFVSSSEDCLNGPNVNTSCQLVTLKSAGPLNQQAFTVSSVCPMPWTEKQLFVFPAFFSSLHLCPSCAVIMLLALHLYEFLHCHNVVGFLSTGGWAAMSG